MLKQWFLSFRLLIGGMWNWILGRKIPPPPDVVELPWAAYKVQNVEELPEPLAPSILYVAGEGSHQWFVAMVCPCGCGEDLTMNLLSEVRPRWTLKIHDDNTATLEPSVLRQVGCKSHFFLQRGRIVWCP